MVVIYIMTAFIGIFFFGSQISESILINIGLEGDNWEADVLRVFFLVILVCHVPFIFFFGKESVLIVIDEYRSKSITQALMNKQAEVPTVKSWESPKADRKESEEQFVEMPEGEQREKRMSLAYKDLPYHIYFTSTVS